MTSWQTKEAGASNALLARLAEMHGRSGRHETAQVLAERWHENSRMIERHTPTPWRPAKRQHPLPQRPLPPIIIKDTQMKVQPPMRFGLDLIEKVAAAFDLTTADIMGRDSTYRIAHPRQAAYYVVHKRYGYSWAAMSSLFKRNHCTIIRGIRAVETRLWDDVTLSRKIESLLK